MGLWETQVRNLVIYLDFKHQVVSQAKECNCIILQGKSISIFTAVPNIKKKALVACISQTGCSDFAKIDYVYLLDEILRCESFTSRSAFS